MRLKLFSKKFMRSKLHRLHQPAMRAQMIFCLTVPDYIANLVMKWIHNFLVCVSGTLVLG
jgi:hypothetical protein